MQRGVVAHPSREPHPVWSVGLRAIAAEKRGGLADAEVERRRYVDPVAVPLPQLVRQAVDPVLQSRQRLRRRHVGRRGADLGVGDVRVERGNGLEERARALAERDASSRDGAAVAHALHFEVDGFIRFTTGDEVGVERVWMLAVDRRARRHQGLAEELAAERPGKARRLVRSAKAIVAERLERERVEQGVERGEDRLVKRGRRHLGVSARRSESAASRGGEPSGC